MAHTPGRDKCGRSCRELDNQLQAKEDQMSAKRMVIVPKVKRASRFRAKYLYSFGANAARAPGSMDHAKSAALNLEIWKRFVGEHVLD